MNKKLLVLSFVIVLIISINLISASFFYPDYRTNDFKETTEFKRTTESKIGDFWDYESRKTTITEKTEVRRRTRTPNYYSPRYSSYSSSYAPYSSWRYKEPYNSKYYGGDNYYYQPRYDYNQGYYNWRW